jgi:hypothetical protein
MFSPLILFSMPPFLPPAAGFHTLTPALGALLLPLICLFCAFADCSSAPLSIIFAIFHYLSAIRYAAYIIFGISILDAISLFMP